MWVLTKVENLHCKICCKTTLIAVDNVSQVCNDQRIALILSLERGAASSYLSSSERSLPRLLHLSYSCTIEAVQQPQYSRTAVQPYALQPFSLPAVVRSYARTPQLDHCQQLQSSSASTIQYTHTCPPRATSRTVGMVLGKKLDAGGRKKNS